MIFLLKGLCIVTATDPDNRKSARTTCPQGLLPVSGKEPTILILGSFPSHLSLEYSEYYGNPRNRFWAVMEALFDTPKTLPYSERTALLSAAGIALWDVAGSCTRAGSADQSIADVIPNDIREFLKTHPSVHCIALNGSTGAGKLFQRFFSDLPEKNRNLTLCTLPSTSPANAASRLTDLIDVWGVLQEYRDAPADSESGKEKIP